MLYKAIIKPVLFALEPEKAHKLTFFLLDLFLKTPFVKFFIVNYFTIKNKQLETNILGLQFANKIGLAAGFDKDAKHIEALQTLGFGHIEIGTLTPKPQPGNEAPRLFRLPKDEAIINRMGFNNLGVDAAVERLKKIKIQGLIIGGNIGKNKVTPNENAVDDYIYCFTKLFEVVDYFVVNVSSPNTPGLRSLQEKEPLKNILNQLQKLNNAKPKRKPILLKIAPDLNQSQLDDIIEIVLETKIDGVVATNTTISRENLKTENLQIESIGAGGLSGKPLTKNATEIIKYLAAKANNKFVIIAVGGIFTYKDAQEKLNAGASLVQLYTGFIYEGPSIVKNINRQMI